MAISTDMPRTATSPMCGFGMQYGYTGPISTSWRSQNPADAATLAEAMATQVLIWETVVGERDEDFDYVSPGSYDAVKGVISTAHLEQCKLKAGDTWDNDEIYFVVEELRKDFPDLSFTQMSDCAGVLILD